MEVCGGHTHTIMKYGLPQLLPANIKFIHGPACPVCIMPKERIDHAYVLAMQEDVILVTLGDMIKVPGSSGTLQDARSRGADVRFVYSPLECIKIAKEHITKKIIFFAIGFETTTPMTAALLDAVIKMGIKKSNAIGRGAIVAGEAIGAKKAVKEVVVHGYGYVKHYIFHV